MSIRKVTICLAVILFISATVLAFTSNKRAEKKAEKQRKNQVEVEVVRTKITLACTECKQRNYNMTKDKKTHPDRMETKKYCRFCKTHTLHKETK